MLDVVDRASFFEAGVLKKLATGADFRSPPFCGGFEGEGLSMNSVQLESIWRLMFDSLTGLLQIGQFTMMLHLQWNKVAR